MPQLFGPKLLYLRQQHTLPQAELARLLGTSRAHINNIEAGRKLPSIALISRVAHLFSVSADYLVRDTIATNEVASSLSTSDVVSWSGSFGEKLKELRLKRGWTQGELAQHLELQTHSHISFLESGRKAPSLELVIDIADIFDVPLDHLISDSRDDTASYPSL